MLYAVSHDDVTLVVAADKLIDFETFASDPQDGDGYTAERADILDMLGEAIFKGYTLSPVKIEGDFTKAQSALGYTLISRVEAVEKQAEMIEHAKLEAEHDQPRDRRTLAEVHGLMEHDPWDNSTEEQKAAGKKEDERMRAVREAGGLTGDSFAGVQGDKLNIHRANITLDKDNEVTGVDLLASKNTIKPYELTIDGDQVDWKEIFDEIKLPENRILHTDGNKVIIKLHDFQTGEIAEALDRRHLNYTLTQQIETIDEETGETFDIEGHEQFDIFYSVQIDQATIHEIIPLIGAEGFDTSLVVTMRNVGRGCWLAFARESQAIECADLVRQKGHSAQLVAINRKGQAIVAGGDDSIRVIDTNEQVDIGPRPWNARAAEYEAMTDEEKAELRKTVQAEEYLITVEENHEHRTVVYIVPESYFREHGEIFEGELILDMVPDEQKAGSILLTALEGTPGAFRGGLEPQLMKDNLCRWGFVESLLLRIHLNDALSDKRVGA